MGVHATLSLTVVLTISLCHCVEEDQPEVFLPPRNFNPHPYVAGYEPEGRPAGNNGPVLFPETPPEPSAGPYQVDANPYVTVAEKRKYKLAGRYQNQDNRLNSAVHKALAAHAAKILRIPPSQLRESYKGEAASPPLIPPRSVYGNDDSNYEFSYKVLDHQSGDDYSHSQSQNSRSTKGQYRVKLPDGRVQTVSYTADKDGYNAQVTYAEDTLGKNQPTPVPNSIDYQQPHQQKYDDYYYEPRFAHIESPSVSPSQPTFPETYHGDHQAPSGYGSNDRQEYITVTAKPYYNLQVVQFRPVQADTGEAKLTKYVQTSEGYVGVVSSTPAPDLDLYNHVTVTPKYEYSNPQYVYAKK